MFRRIRSPRQIVGLAALLLAVVPIACGQDPGTAAPRAGQPAAASPSSGPSAVTRDLSTFDVCLRLPAADVAEILGSTPDRTSGKATMLSYASDCTYTIALGEGMSGYAMVFLYPPEMWDPTLFDEGEKIDGLGDDAYLTENGSFAEVSVLVAGDLVLQVRASSPDQARKLAELALSRLAAAAD